MANGELADGKCPTCRANLKGGWTRAARGVMWKTVKRKPRYKEDETSPQKTSLAAKPPVDLDADSEDPAAKLDTTPKAETNEGNSVVPTKDSASALAQSVK